MVVEQADAAKPARDLTRRCCLLILLYVQHEVSYDTYHEKADRIHRLVLTYKTAIEEPRLGVLTPPTFAPLLLKDYPEIEHVVRFQPQDYIECQKIFWGRQSAGQGRHRRRHPSFHRYGSGKGSP